jgi:hypothetical protein
LEKIDFTSFEKELEKKLDVILCEGHEQPNVPKRKSDRVIIYPLHNLKKIVLSLEWEISEESIIQYLKQLKYLGEIFAKDKNITVLLKIQTILGKYIKRFKSDTNPYAFIMIQTAFRSLDKIICGKNLPDSEKRQLISLEIKRYKKLKQLLDKNKNVYLKKRVIQKRPKAKPDPCIKNHSHNTKKAHGYTKEFLIYRQLLQKSISEMKLFIRNELRNLRIELQTKKV